MSYIPQVSLRPKIFLWNLLVLICLSALPTFAMDLPHYDVYSLVYMSTDIVVARLSVDEQKNISAVVTESLYGSLQKDQRIERLTPFLMFFRPMEDGVRVILFLDRRPRKYDFFHSEAAQSPFAVPPSGMYLIDEYEHVHEFFQPNNPGPYVAEGYSFFLERRVPTKEQDLALSPLAEVKAKISEATKTVEPIRSLLGKTASSADVPALMSLIDRTSASEKNCELRFAEAIHRQAIQQIRTLNDPALLLRAYSTGSLSAHPLYAPDFIYPIDNAQAKRFVDDRVRYLVRTFGDRKQDPQLRAAALKILLKLAAFRSGSHQGPSISLPIDNEWLRSSAAEIQSTAKAIFEDPSQNEHLRALSLGFLPTDEPDVIRDIRRMYSRTASSELRFAVENAFLSVSDDLYQSLNAPGGPVASRVSVLTDCGCNRKTHGGSEFLMEYRERRDFHKSSFGRVTAQMVLTSSKNTRRVSFSEIRVLTGWSGSYEGASQFTLPTFPELPAGKYKLFFQYTEGKEVVSSGYGVEIPIPDSR